MAVPQPRVARAPGASANTGPFGGSLCRSIGINGGLDLEHLRINP